MSDTDSQTQAQEPASLWLAPTAIVMGLIVAVFVTLFIEALGAAGGSSLQHPSPAVTLFSQFGYEGAFVGTALYLVLVRGGRRFIEFGYRRIRWWVGVSGVVIAGGGYYLISWGYSALFALHGTDKLPSELGATKTTAATIGTALFVCVTAPIAEEFFFRGFLFGVLRRMRVRIGGHDLGPWLAAVIVGVVFGAAHASGTSAKYLIPLGLLGFILCLVRWKTDSLYPCMALHALNNSVALGVDELNWGPGPIIAVAIGSLLVIGLVTWPLSRPGNRPAPAAAG